MIDLRVISFTAENHAGSHLDSKLSNIESGQNCAYQTDHFRVWNHRIPRPRNIKILRNENHLGGYAETYSLNKLSHPTLAHNRLVSPVDLAHLPKLELRVCPACHG